MHDWYPRSRTEKEAEKNTRKNNGLKFPRFGKKHFITDLRSVNTKHSKYKENYTQTHNNQTKDKEKNLKSRGTKDRLHTGEQYKGQLTSYKKQPKPKDSGMMSFKC